MDYSEGPDVPLLLDESFHLAQMNAFTLFFPKQIDCFVPPLELAKTLKTLCVFKTKCFSLSIKQEAIKAFIKGQLVSCVSFCFLSTFFCQSLKYMREKGELSIFSFSLFFFYYFKSKKQNTSGEQHSHMVKSNGLLSYTAVLA